MLQSHLDFFSFSFSFYIDPSFFAIVSTENPQICGPQYEVLCVNPRIWTPHKLYYNFSQKIENKYNNNRLVLISLIEVMIYGFREVKNHNMLCRPIGLTTICCGLVLTWQEYHPFGWYCTRISTGAGSRAIFFKSWIYSFFGRVYHPNGRWHVVGSLGSIGFISAVKSIIFISLLYIFTSSERINPNGWYNIFGVTSENWH